MNAPLDIPVAWSVMLGAVQSLCPEAIVVGGAIRDLHNDRPVKDVDIFVCGLDQGDLYGLHARLSEVIQDVKPLDPSKFYPVGCVNDVIGVIDIQPKNMVPVQIVMLRGDDLSNVLERIDYGICRISWDGQMVTRTKDYDADRISQVFRMRHERTGVALSSSVHRYARLSQKYEGWKWVPYEEPDAWESVL